jgi:hypothetical protein
MIVNCKNCGASFKTYEFYLIRRPNGPFCSHNCFYQWRRRHLSEFKSIAKSLNKKNIRRIKTTELKTIMGMAGSFKIMLDEYFRRLEYARAETKAA